MRKFSGASLSPELKLKTNEFFRELKTLLKKSPLPPSGHILFMEVYRGQTNSNLARRLDLSPSSFHTLMTGEMDKKSNLKTLEKVAYVLNCDFFYCFIPKDIPLPEDNHD